MRVFGISMIVLLVTGFVVTLLNPAFISDRSKPEQFRQVLSGDWADAYQTSFDLQSPLRDVGLEVWGSLRFGFFREGLPGVAVGSDNWLFTSEEFISLPSQAREEERAAAAAGYIAGVRQQLQDYGAQLLVVPVPAKARVYAEKLGRYRFPSQAEQRYTDFLAALERNGVPAVNLLPVLKGDKESIPASPPQLHSPGRESFLHTDTHWSPAGAEAAAALVADRLRTLGALTDASGRSYQVELGSELVYEGDLLNFIPLGPFRGRLQPEPDVLYEVVVEAGPPPTAGLFDDAAVPVVLVGTSYSAAETWGFQAFLQYNLQHEVLNLAEEGEGPFAPMRSYLQSDTLREAPPAAVLWEIPERYLPTTENPGGE